VGNQHFSRITEQGEAPLKTMNTLLDFQVRCCNKTLGITFLLYEVKPRFLPTKMAIAYVICKLSIHCYLILITQIVASVFSIYKLFAITFMIFLSGILVGVFRDSQFYLSHNFFYINLKTKT